MSNTPSTAELPFPRAGFMRRLGAMVYDALMALAIYMMAGMIAMLVLTLLLENGVLSMKGYEHVSDVINNSEPLKWTIQAWCGVWVMGFFLWFWKNGGQTIGMRAWRLRLFSTNDKPFGYGRALWRMLASLGGLGTLLVFVDVKNKQALQDWLAGTQVLVLSKDANHHKAWRQTL